MKRRYDRPEEGQWIRPVKKGYRLACCDCGLVHEMEFAHTPYGGGRKIAFRAWRDERSTAAMRRENRRKAEARSAD